MIEGRNKKESSSWKMKIKIIDHCSKNEVVYELVKILKRKYSCLYQNFGVTYKVLRTVRIVRFVLNINIHRGWYII